jgi:hypothetical protein
MSPHRRAARLLQAAMLAAALSLAAPAFAHGLLVSARSDGDTVAGRVYYSDGAPGAGEYVEFRDLTDPARPARTAAADATGGFRFPGVPGHRYAVIAHGEEGHTTELQVELRAGERARLSDAAPADAAGLSLPPAWMLIGALLLLSTVPALWLRARRNRPADLGR